MAGKLLGKKVVILVAHEYEDIELLYPLLRFAEEGAEVDVVPVPLGFHPRPFVEGKPITGRFGHPIPAPALPEGRRYHMRPLEEVNPDEVDLLFVPGGFAPDYIRRSQKALELVRACHERGKILGTICHGPWVFISAKILNGKRVTGVIALKDDLINAGAEYVDAPVVRDGNILTSRAPNDLPDLCPAIIDAVCE